METESRADIVTSRLQERRHEIERVVQLSSRKLSGLLDSLSVECAQPLLVKYSVPMQGRSISSPVLERRVLSLIAEGVILIDTDDKPPWPELVRELAGYLKDDDAGQVASGLYQALAPPTREDASDLLDSLGFPPFDDEPLSDVPGAEAGALGVSHESSEYRPVTRADSRSACKSTSRSADRSAGWPVYEAHATFRPRSIAANTAQKEASCVQAQQVCDVRGRRPRRGSGAGRRRRSCWPVAR